MQNSCTSHPRIKAHEFTLHRVSRLVFTIRTSFSSVKSALKDKTKPVPALYDKLMVCAAEIIPHDQPSTPPGVNLSFFRALLMVLTNDKMSDDILSVAMTNNVRLRCLGKDASQLDDPFLGCRRRLMLFWKCEASFCVMYLVAALFLVYE